MSMQTLRIGKQQFVLVPKRDFDRIQQENERYRHLRDEDRALGALADRELRAFRKSGGKGTPWEQVKRELGL
jgi:hypothetical protein